MPSWKQLPIELPQHPDQMIRDAVFFKEKIKAHIESLLIKDATALFQWLYEIDVSEEKVKVLFKNIPQQNDFVNALTEIVFERLLLKVKIRNIYS